MEFCLLDGGEGREHDGVCFMELSKIFATHDAFSLPLDQSTECITRDETA